jgi:hypothetical protein
MDALLTKDRIYEVPLTSQYETLHSTLFKIFMFGSGKSSNIGLISNLTE